MIKRPNGALSRLHADHRAKVLQLLAQHGPSSKAQLAKRMGVSRTTTGNICEYLLSNGDLIETSDIEPVGATGRPGRLLDLNPRVGFVVGLDFVVGQLKICLLDRRKRRIDTTTIADDSGFGTLGMVRLLRRRVEKLLLENGLAYEGLKGVGLGLIGPVGGASRQTELARFAEVFQVPIAVVNNVRAAAAAVFFGASGDQVTDAVYLRLSDGIGSAILVGGNLLDGTGQRAGEIGHIVIDPSGRHCSTFEHRGCLEALAGARTVLSSWSSDPTATLTDFHRALAAGEPAALSQSAQSAAQVGQVLAGVVRLLDPERVILDGKLLDPAGVFFTQLEQSTFDYLDGLEQNVQLLRSAPDPYAGALGAALSAL